MSDKWKWWKWPDSRKEDKLKEKENYQKAFDLTYQDLCEYYDGVKKDTHCPRWQIMAVLNKNRQLIIDDLNDTHKGLEFNKSIYNKALNKLNNEYDTDYDKGMSAAFGWRHVGFNAITNQMGVDDKPKKEKPKVNEDLEKEMDVYDLTDEEKELVRSGEYDPWDFEYPSDHPNEEMDDDDYYEDDDI